ncbi:MAG: protein-glutamate O-methyltransferase CheR [Polyangiaceae bacterium]|nr:protein-glutamate O-methyltransferase CheR [Myxococcales bacterium]MCB9584861.1 protein-glutamate O-methyltransferase CheR [Polyangiaceae bacterium]MCB9607566.1 protein-glutamate O-methyltransferase CheR [Polyangiaceae bacterium]
MRPDEFRLLRDAFNEYAGLHFDDDAAYLFERRLSERLEALDLTGFDDYYKYLRFNLRGRSELEEAVELLTTKETYLFRQEYQLRAFRDELLPRLWEANRTKRRLSVWSAGCSTGEEVYSIAILIEQSGLFDGWDVRVIGSDLSRRNVARARAGVYRGASFRAMPDAVRDAFFTEVPGGERGGRAYQANDVIRRKCHFGQLNLLDTSTAPIVGRVDAIFCRNVLIYFDVQSRRRVIDMLYDRLFPGGYLMLGHSESLLNVSTAFELVHLTEDLVYRRPVGAGGRRG